MGDSIQNKKSKLLKEDKFIREIWFLIFLQRIRLNKKSNIEKS